MTPLADRIPTMSDTDLASLRANAAHLAEHGSANQMVAASDVMPVIDTEVARRAALPKPPKPPRKPTAKKPPPATGHQTALAKA